MKHPPNLNRRRFLRNAGFAGLAAFLGTTGIIAQSYRFEVNYHERTLPHLKAHLRIAHLSDLHYNIYVSEKRLAAWVDATLETNPDMVLLTGDFIDRTTVGSLEPLACQLRKLQPPLGMYGVWGNHDYDQGIAKRDELGAVLTSAGVRILVNEGINVRDDIYLAGIDDIWEGKQQVWKVLNDKPKDRACIFMSHIPDIFPGMLEYGYTADLNLAGHNHGGQIKLPFLGAVAVPSQYGTRFLEGWVEEPQILAFISRGLGFTDIPIRWNSRAEIAILDLVGQEIGIRKQGF
ncbi:MAG: metallophosphoesterase [Trueperaceae bacterium]